MKSYLNRAATQKTKFKSAGVSVLSYTAHQLKNSGTYLGKIYQDKKVINEFHIVCSDECKETQANINIADFNLHDSSNECQRKYEISPNGYLLFYDSKSNKDFRIKIEKASKTKKVEVQFDSLSLNKGDLYVATLLHPGIYKGLNLKNNTEFKVNVVYPDKKLLKKVNQVKQPITVDVNEKGFSQGIIKTLPGQGIVFNINTPSDIELNLHKEHKKPQEANIIKPSRGKKAKKIRRRFRWENPTKSKGNR